MNVLFVHQNFPGQFKHLAPALAKAGHRVEAMGIDGAGLREIEMHRYRPARGSSPGIHPWATDFETKIIRGEACAAAAARLKAGGFTPDVIVTNPGWGESLFLKDVWPRAKMLALIEFFYAARGLDCDFDPEFAKPTLANDARVRTKNANMLIALTSMDHGVCPTAFQRSTVPAMFQDRLSVIFDGIDTNVVRPDPKANLKVGDRTLRAGDEIVTFINRNLEPMRGYHIFMRALPGILRARPNAVALIVGGDEVSYGAPPPAGKTWKQIFLDEVKERLDVKRVIFLGRIAYVNYLRVLQISACHVYLTYPFVLGWSCIEALSAGCVVVGSATPPVKEVIEDGKNGLLVDFLDTAKLAKTVVDALAHPAKYSPLRAAARSSAVARYDLASVCLPQQLQLIDKLAAGML
jgi:glycosyltransferase involved in cell wall biosynthesis